MDSFWSSEHFSQSVFGIFRKQFTQESHHTVIRDQLAARNDQDEKFPANVRYQPYALLDHAPTTITSLSIVIKHFLVIRMCVNSNMYRRSHLLASVAFHPCFQR